MAGCESAPAPECTPSAEVTLTPTPEPTPAPTVSCEQIDALSNENNGWGFRKIEGSRPEFTKGQTEIMDRYDCIYMGDETAKYMYLTFDEGYENGCTAQILDTLKKTDVPAAFFITGPYLDKERAIVDRMVNEGHTVGNHTVNHPNMPSLKTAAAMQEEILSLDRKFYEIYGSHMQFLRPPEGAYSERSLSAAKSLGYTSVFWSLAYKDWEVDNQKGADYAFEKITSQFHNGCVLLLHAVSKDNADALEAVINEAKAQGYTFLPLSEYKK